MAAALPACSATGTMTVSVEQRRWMVIGVCLNKVITPRLRKVLANEIPKWHQTLVNPPHEIDKQTYAKHLKTIPPSSLKLNYDSINMNSVHRTPKAYDYSVKDALSLAKLFMKPFMANFTGFDQTMDTSAVLSIMCEAQPFIASGADAIAKKVRSDIRNEWAHCNFTHWTKPNFQNAIQTMQSLAKRARMTPSEEKDLVDELESWKIKGIHLCLGQPVDPELLKLVQDGFADLQESVKILNEDAETKSQLLKNLAQMHGDLEEQMRTLKERQDSSETNYITTVMDIEKVKNEIAKISEKNEEIPYVFQAPKSNPWFSGRRSEIQKLRDILGTDETIQPRVILAAVCGLGGSGKTSLVTEYAKQMKDYYKGGVYWLHGENEAKLQSSANDVAMRLGTFQSDSFDFTLSKTLATISRNREPWLLVLDDMDELNLSPTVRKIVSGSWQQHVSGNLIITTRRKPKALANVIRDFSELSSLNLECFPLEEAKAFLFHRTSLTCDKVTEPVAESLVSKLGCLPLALEQAGAYIASLGCTLSEYMELYDSQSLELLDQQKAIPVSDYESEERLAVLTTWFLNFEHIRNSPNGMVAIRFLNASSFFSPNEIQQELINVGEPLLDDKKFRACVNTSIGIKQIVKLLTDFSLFREVQPTGCLSVHRLVQEVIQENLEPEQKAGSIVDAVRMLRFAFCKCPTPDELLLSVVNLGQQRPSVTPTNPSHFYEWGKLCMHTYELVENVEKLARNWSGNLLLKSIFLPETAKVVYECALHLSVNCKRDEAKGTADFAKRILNWSDLEVSEEKYASLFPHTLPLPRPIQRYIQYSCREPPTMIDASDSEEGFSVGSEEADFEKMRLEGNRYFRECHFKDSVEMYSRAIKMSRGSDSFDPRLLSNRASAYLKLEQYENALEDAKQYVLLRPDCWKGYARKALALNGLGEDLDAKMQAALAFYRERSIFRDFEPFKNIFPGLENCIRVCGTISQLSSALRAVSSGQHTSMSDNILVVEPGEYCISANSFHWSRIIDQPTIRISGVEGPDPFRRLFVGYCILIGAVDKFHEPAVRLTFESNFGLGFGDCVAANLFLEFDVGNCRSLPGSFAEIFNCSFTCNHDWYPALFVDGRLNANFCNFKNCRKGGVLVQGEGAYADVQNSVFCGDGMIGLEARLSGRLMMKNSKLFGNQQGLVIGPKSGPCVVEDCDFYDNDWANVTVGDASDVKLVHNRIYHSDGYGVLLDQYSSAIIERNEIFENNWWGIWAQKGSWCCVSRNEIYHNKTGGVHICPLDPKGVFPQESRIEYNKIFGNDGPGINDSESPRAYNEEPPVYTPPANPMLPKCIKNEETDNIEDRLPRAIGPELQLCYYCRKRNDSLQKCLGCFTAEYCGRRCQKCHWKKHKSACILLLEKSSLLLEFNQDPKLANRDSRAPGLLPVGRQYCEPPKVGTRFIVKVDAGAGIPYQKNTSCGVALYDRSLTVTGTLMSFDIHSLVREYGAPGKVDQRCKMLFMWAMGPRNGFLRLFTQEFAPYQNW